jgi:hypothetical protein
MKSLHALFTEHPASVGETYWQHLATAMGFSLRLIAAGLCCLVHALLPFLFVRTASRTVTELHDRMLVNRARISTAAGTGHQKGARALST